MAGLRLLSCPGCGAARKRCAADPEPIPLCQWVPDLRSSARAPHPVRDTEHLLPINRLRIEHLVRIHERQSRPAFAVCVDLPVEAGTPASVARRACLLDPDPDGVLIAIHPHLDHALDMAGGFAFSPQRVAG